VSDAVNLAVKPPDLPSVVFVVKPSEDRHTASKTKIPFEKAFGPWQVRGGAQIQKPSQKGLPPKTIAAANGV
jgi:hypothetical protein